MHQASFFFKDQFACAPCGDTGVIKEWVVTPKKQIIPKRTACPCCKLGEELKKKFGVQAYEPDMERAD